METTWPRSQGEIALRSRWTSQGDVSLALFLGLKDGMIGPCVVVAGGLGTLGQLGLTA